MTVNCGYEDLTTTVRTTMSSKLTIVYPFHPYFQQQLKILKSPRKPDGCFVVRDPTGRDLAVPRWMVEEPTTQFVIGDSPHFPQENLRALCRLIDSVKNTRIPNQRDTEKGDFCVSTNAISRKRKGVKPTNTR